MRPRKFVSGEQSSCNCSENVTGMHSYSCFRRKLPRSELWCFCEGLGICVKLEKLNSGAPSTLRGLYPVWMVLK